MKALVRTVVVAVALALLGSPLQANLLSDAGFEGFGTTTLPDNATPAGAWTMTDGEADPNMVRIDARPGGPAGEHALHLTLPSQTQATGQSFTSFGDPADKLITYHERYVGTAGDLGGVFSVGRSTITTLSNSAVTLAFGNDSNKTDIQYFSGGSYNVLAPFSAGHWYQVRADIELAKAALPTGTYQTVDYFVRSDTDTRYSRWTQIGWNRALAAGSGATLSDLSRVHIGQFNRTTPDDAYFDNVLVAPQSARPTTVHYTNGFESPTYAAGQTAIGQDAWQRSGGSDALATIVDAATIGSPDHGQVFKLTNAPLNGVYQDLDAVADAGIVDFSVDVRPTDMRSGELSWLNFSLGSSNLITTTWEDAVARFGLYCQTGMNPHIGVYNGNGAGSGTWVPLGDVSNDEWYHLSLRLYLTGARRNTWDFRAYNDALTLDVSMAGLGFRTNYTDITRIGILNLGSRATTGMYFDNLDLRDIPEPTTLALLGLGAALAARRRRRRD